MTDTQIKEQVEAIRSVTKEATSSKGKAAAFLKAAGIVRNPAKGDTPTRPSKKQ